MSSHEKITASLWLEWARGGGRRARVTEMKRSLRERERVWRSASAGWASTRLAARGGVLRLMLLSGSLHHHQTQRDALNQLFLLLLLVCPIFSSRCSSRKRSQSVFYFFLPHFLCFSHAQPKHFIPRQIQVLELGINLKLQIRANF